MFSKILAVASIATAANAQVTYVATFENNDVAGTVTVDNGLVTVDIDLSAMPSLPANFSYCTGGTGMSYHIHELWTYGTSDTADRLGGDCGGSYTGGHWDPWNACGAASGNPYCKKATSTDPTACIPTSAYSPDFENDPFSAEVGDWSNKYAKLTLDSANKLFAEVSSFYEVRPAEMMGKSVVFHCNDGSRAFCAPFLASSDATSGTYPDQDSVKAVSATFDVLSADSMIVLYPDGTISVDLDASDVYDDAVAGCDDYEFSIFEAGGSTLSGSALGDACDGKVGDQYDPTKQCLPWSGQPNCTMGVLCGDDSYMYDCDFDNDRYSCAPGDLSGKLDAMLSGDTALSMTMDGSGGSTLLPNTESLIGKVIAITCPYSNSTGGNPEYLACAAIEEYTDGIGRVSVVIAFMLSFTALLY